MNAEVAGSSPTVHHLSFHLFNSPKDARLTVTFHAKCLALLWLE
jgi:hypothetical protein